MRTNPATLLLLVLPCALHALEYPGTPPGRAERSVTGGRVVLANAAGFRDDVSGLAIRWSAAFDDGANEMLSARFGRKNKRRTEQIEGILETLKRLGRV